jgi:hypothetical protein
LLCTFPSQSDQHGYIFGLFDCSCSCDCGFCTQKSPPRAPDCGDAPTISVTVNVPAPHRFCTDREKVLHDYETVPAGQYWPVPEYAAMVSGPQGAGVVRTRVNNSGVYITHTIAPVDAMHLHLLKRVANHLDGVNG